MIRKESNGIHWLEFEIFADFPKLKHAVFLRHGGFSQGKYASLNLSYGLGDESSNVAKNVEKVRGILGNPTLCWARQVHGKKIERVGEDWANHGKECDALATDQTGQGLMVHHADCQAAILYDPVHHAVANIHCGWRGSVQNIYAEVVGWMRSAYGSRPQDLFVGISPSLGPENAEFIHYREELPEHFWEYQVKPTYFDFWAISENQLRQCGLLKEHIQVAGISTYAHPEDYYSYRLIKVRGGHGTVAVLL